jgi:hypothetical protein
MDPPFKKENSPNFHGVFGFRLKNTKIDELI